MEFFRFEIGRWYDTKFCLEHNLTFQSKNWHSTINQHFGIAQIPWLWEFFTLLLLYYLISYLWFLAKKSVNSLYEDLVTVSCVFWQFFIWIAMFWRVFVVFLLWSDCYELSAPNSNKQNIFEAQISANFNFHVIVFVRSKMKKL